jgi:hypothetical protein
VLEASHTRLSESRRLGLTWSSVGEFSNSNLDPPFAASEGSSDARHRVRTHRSRTCHPHGPRDPPRAATRRVTPIRGLRTDSVRRSENAVRRPRAAFSSLGTQTPFQRYRPSARAARALVLDSFGSPCSSPGRDASRCAWYASRRREAVTVGVDPDTVETLGRSTLATALPHSERKGDSRSIPASETTTGE